MVECLFILYIGKFNCSIAVSRCYLMCSFHGSLPLKACQKASLSSAPVSACHRSMVKLTRPLSYSPILASKPTRYSIGLSKAASPKENDSNLWQRKELSKQEKITNKSKATGASGSQASGRNSKARAISWKLTWKCPSARLQPKQKGQGIQARIHSKSNRPNRRAN